MGALWAFGLLVYFVHGPGEFDLQDGMYRVHRAQKKGVLSESALPEELRLALAQNMHNDMFFQVREGRRINSQ